MITISQVTEELISKEPFIQELMAENLINLSALARKIKPEIEKRLLKEVKESAVVMALKRQAPIINPKSILYIKELSNLAGDITIRSKLTDFTFVNSDTLNACHQEMLKVIGDHKDVFYTYSKGVRETTIILSTLISQHAEDIFRDEQMIDRSENLSSLTMKLPKKNKTQPGLYYFILKNIARAGINIYEVISTTNEFTLIVEDKDIDQTFSVIKSM
jgi:hypothetical protein